MCEGVFNRLPDEEWSAEDQEKELKRDFGDVPEDDREVVCDDCYQKMRPDKNPEVFQAWLSEQPDSDEIIPLS